MRTSEEIYHRVRWDPRFDPARFVLGVGQRGRDPKRVPLPTFVPGGDVPWHRVLFFEADGELVWDRATGLDRIDAATRAGYAPAPPARALLHRQNPARLGPGRAAGEPGRAGARGASTAAVRV